MNKSYYIPKTIEVETFAEAVKILEGLIVESDCNVRICRNANKGYKVECDLANPAFAKLRPIWVTDEERNDIVEAREYNANVKEYIENLQKESNKLYKESLELDDKIKNAKDYEYDLTLKDILHGYYWVDDGFMWLDDKIKETFEFEFEDEDDEEYDSRYFDINNYLHSDDDDDYYMYEFLGNLDDIDW